MAFLSFTSVLFAVVVAMAFPPAWREESWKRFFLAAILSIIGILGPLFVFVASGLIVPQWKGACPFGALNCFHVGKLVLTPFVLWAVVAFYTSQILRLSDERPPWIVLGIFAGAVVSTVCLVFGTIISLPKPDTLPQTEAWFLLVPLYTAVWYTILSIRMMRRAGLGPRPYLLTVLGTMPFWFLCELVCREKFRELPDTPPHCFVVTAALRGHPRLVGAFDARDRRGAARRVNCQLLTFWQFEAAWQQRAPRAHRLFRRAYNRLGPVVAARVQSPFAADLVYLLLKPLEWSVRLGTVSRRGAEAQRIL